MVSRSQLLPELDRQKAALAARHPGWHIWYVPSGTSSGISHVTWCAQRKPTLNCGSPEELSKAIGEAEAAHLAEAQAFGHPAQDGESRV